MKLFKKILITLIGGSILITSCGQMNNFFYPTGACRGNTHNINESRWMEVIENFKFLKEGMVYEDIVKKIGNPVQIIKDTTTTTIYNACYGTINIIYENNKLKSALYKLKTGQEIDILYYFSEMIQDYNKDLGYYEPGFAFDTDGNKYFTDYEDIYCIENNSQSRKIYDGNLYISSVLYQGGYFFITFYDIDGLFRIDLSNGKIAKIQIPDADILLYADKGYIYFFFYGDLYSMPINGKPILLIEVYQKDLTILGYYNGKIYYRLMDEYTKSNSIYEISRTGERKKIADGTCYEISNKGILIYEKNGKLYKLNLETFEESIIGIGVIEIDIDKYSLNEYAKQSTVYLGKFNKEYYFEVLDVMTKQLYSIEYESNNVPNKKIINNEEVDVYKFDEINGYLYYKIYDSIFRYNLSDGKKEKLNYDDLIISHFQNLTFTDKGIYYIGIDYIIRYYDFKKSKTEIIFPERVKCENRMP